MATDFTRLVLPDGNGRTVSGQLGFVPGMNICKGDIAEWPELNGWKVVERRTGYGGRCERGEWRGGSCTYLMLGLS